MGQISGSLNGGGRAETYEGGRKVLEVDAESSLDGSSSGNDAATLESPLDRTERVVHRPLHLVQEVVYVRHSVSEQNEDKMEENGAHRWHP